MKILGYYCSICKQLLQKNFFRILWQNYMYFYIKKKKIWMNNQINKKDEIKWIDLWNSKHKINIVSRINISNKLKKIK